MYTHGYCMARCSNKLTTSLSSRSLFCLAIRNHATADTSRDRASLFPKFINLWPTLKDLASSELEDVLKAWTGLGYYSRARNLRKCADIVYLEYRSRFPDDVESIINSQVSENIHLRQYQPLHLENRLQWLMAMSNG
ncbi:MAG: hypothetical protein GY761_01025 [Hyphomicrobiales bacterium]|nr:hypothetical protein [Hyphomicrobiales bacterium]